MGLLLNRVSTDFGVLCVIAEICEAKNGVRAGRPPFQLEGERIFGPIGFRPGTVCGKLSNLCFLEKPIFVLNLLEDVDSTNGEYRRVRESEEKIGDCLGRWDRWTSVVAVVEI